MNTRNRNMYERPDRTPYERAMYRSVSAHYANCKKMKVTTEPHPDHHTDYARLKAIKTGGRKAIEDKAIAAYMKAFEEQGREEAERIFFSFFNKVSHEI